MPRFKSALSGVVVSVDEDTAKRLGMPGREWSSADEKKAPASKSASSNKSD